jgi:hypothetical protein
VTRFPAADPSKVENFDTGINNSGLNIDSQGNVWVTNRFGTGVRALAHLAEMALHLKFEGVEAASDYLTKTMSEQKGGPDGGSVTLLRPDGSPYLGSPFKGGGLPGPWAVVVDGNDNVWISNFAGVSSPIVQLCGVRTENCPPGYKTGDQISPPGGYVGGGLQMQTDLGISPGAVVTDGRSKRRECHARYGSCVTSIASLRVRCATVREMKEGPSPPPSNGKNKRSNFLGRGAFVRNRLRR